MVTYPGTDTTKGVTYQPTNEDLLNYILHFLPFISISGTQASSAPESFFSNVPGAFGLKLTYGVTTATGNWYKNIAVLGYHAQAS